MQGFAHAGDGRLPVRVSHNLGKEVDKGRALLALVAVVLYEFKHLLGQFGQRVCLASGPVQACLLYSALSSTDPGTFLRQRGWAAAGDTSSPTTVCSAAT